MGIQEGMRVEAFKLWLEGITPGDFLALEAQWMGILSWTPAIVGGRSISVR